MRTIASLLLKRSAFVVIVLFLRAGSAAGVQFKEENPRLASTWMFEMRMDAERRWDPGVRWEAFLSMRKRQLRKTEAVPAAQWRSLGPNTLDNFSGRIISHAFDPVDHTVIYAGSATGGLWRTSTAGDSWEPMMQEFPAMEISAVAVNPFDRNEIIIGTGVDKFNDQTIRPGVGVFRSTDRGMTWELTSYSYQRNQNIGVARIVWDPSGTGCVFMASSNGIWKSTDHGNTWGLKRSGRSSALVINKKDPAILFASFIGSGIYRSTDAGETWSILTSGIPFGSTVGYSSMAICDSLPDNVVVSMSHSSTFNLRGLFRSTNSGNTWSLVTPPAMDYLCQPADQSQCQGWFCNVVAVSPSDPQHIVAGGVTFWSTKNGGDSWTRHDLLKDVPSLEAGGKSHTYVDQMDVAFDPVDREVMYVFNDGGIQRTSDNGATWAKKNLGLVTAHFYKFASASSDTNILSGGLQDHGLQVLNNAGGNTEWKRWYGNDGVEVIIHPANPAILYGNVFMGAVFKSITGGSSWLKNTIQITGGINEAGKLAPPLVMDPAHPETLYTAMNTKIFRTVNGGFSWSAVAVVPNVYTMSIDPVSTNIVYAHSYTNAEWNVWRSENCGTTWKPISHPSIPSWRVVDLQCDPVKSGTIYAVRNSSMAQQDHIKRSTDFGETWTDITADLPDITMNAITISPVDPQHLYIATDLGVFASTNGGGGWFEFNDGMPVAYASDIHYHPIDRTVRVATLGRGVFKTRAIDGVTHTEQAGSIMPVMDFTLSNNFPNPFNPGTTLSYSVPREGSVTVDIYNQTGQLVYSFPPVSVSAGSYSVQWQGVNSIGQPVSAGTYFGRVTYLHFSKTVKMQLIR